METKRIHFLYGQTILPLWIGEGSTPLSSASNDLTVAQVIKSIPFRITTGAEDKIQHISFLMSWAPNNLVLCHGWQSSLELHIRKDGLRVSTEVPPTPKNLKSTIHPHQFSQGSLPATQSSGQTTVTWKGKIWNSFLKFEYPFHSKCWWKKN